MNPSDASAVLSTASERPLTVLLFFRGDWCPFCQAWLRELDRDFRERVEAVGGRIVAVTSHGEAGADHARTAWGLRFPVLSQPDNALARRYGVAITPRAATPLAGHPTEYPDGMAQPAAIALDAAGNVLYRWAIDPAEANLGGASDRPLPAELWSAIEAARRGEPVAPFRGDRLDPAFLAAHYPAQHEVFVGWMAAAAAAR